MNFSTINFPCLGCGASQVYQPQTGKLGCEFCDMQTDIPLPTQDIASEDYLATIHILNELRHSEPVVKEVACKRCGANFALDNRDFASLCSYCNTPTMIECTQDITPNGLLPFTISQKDAQKRFKVWVGSRWFAPNAFKEYLDESKKLVGYYFPYWSYDTQTVSHYQGQRGDRYFVTVPKRVEVNGREELRSVQESRIAWSHASGVVQGSFDDITVGATNTIKRDRLDAIDPWHTNELCSFDLQYISGFKAEEYSIEIEDGFEIAKDKISPTIRQKIKYDIGGDQQRIDSVNTQYNDIAYKSLLFPVWVASFVWNDKNYEYAINGQTGKIVGERPYSYIKIALAVLATVVVVGGIYYFTQGK